MASDRGSYPFNLDNSPRDAHLIHVIAPSHPGDPPWMIPLGSSWLRQRASNRWGDRSAIGEPINLAVSCFNVFRSKSGLKSPQSGFLIAPAVHHPRFPLAGLPVMRQPRSGRCCWIRQSLHHRPHPKAIALMAPPGLWAGRRLPRFSGNPATPSPPVIQRLKPVGHSGHHAPVEAWRSAPCIRVGPLLSLTDFSDLSQFRMLRNWPDRPSTG